MNKSEKIFVAGHRGMVGSALTRALEAAGFNKLIKRDRSELDLGVLAHRAGVELADLVAVHVGRADEARGVLEQ